MMQRSDERRQGMRGWVKRHPVASFFVLAYAISWLASVPAALGYGFMFFFTQFGPALAALIVTWYSGAPVRGWARKIVRWRVAPRWYAVAIGLPILLVGTQVAIFALLGGPIFLSLLPGALAGFVPSLAILTLDAGLGEEPGWRGLALPGLQTAYTPVIATAVLGILWAFWHFPMVFIDERFPHGFTSIAPLVLLAILTVVGIALMAFFYTWVYNATQSVLLCMLLHGSFNTATGNFPAPLEVLQRGVYVKLLVVQDITLLLAVAILVVATGGRLGYAAASRRTPKV
jgi:membrane protease YdiL (CAAX protease family)